MTKTIITAALPYANAPIHIGHLVEYVQADVFVRFLKLIQQDALYICASDMHGTPIEVKAQEQGVPPHKFARKFHQQNKATFQKYLINFDNYHHTDSKENKELAEQFFTALKKKNLIYQKEIEVIYCPKCNRNLPDRYVKGTCPNCGAYDQYGDICESCNLTLKGTDLINPKCSICQSTPVKKQSNHYFFKLSKFSNKLKTWLNKTPLQPEIKNSVKEWIHKGLEDWCISRDSPYYGFEIPGEKDKYFYVWLDAPIGYISSTKNLTKHWEDYWKKGKIIHVIGKDIIYFHFLFWPAMLEGAGFKKPDDLVVHGFLTVNGQKMSKSRGTFFTAEEFLELYPAEALRFYYAHHLSKKMADLDLDFEDFKDTINNKLVANLANFCYRTLSFNWKNYQGKTTKFNEKKLIDRIKKIITQIEKNYSQFNFKQAIADILKISSLGNVYFQENQPWTNPKEKQAQVSFCVNLVKNLSILIKPVLPEFSLKIEKALGTKPLLWKDLDFSFQKTTKKPELLVQKIEKTPQAAKFPLDLKIGEITKVEDHPQADKLYILQINFGKEKRQAVAGLKGYFKKETLLNKKTVFCLNLKPAKLRGIQSTCMILVANDHQNLSLLEAQDPQPGDEVTLEGYQNSQEQISFEEFKKIKMFVQGEKVTYQTKHLKTDKGAVSVRGAKEGAWIE